VTIAVKTRKQRLHGYHDRPGTERRKRRKKRSELHTVAGAAVVLPPGKVSDTAMLEACCCFSPAAGKGGETRGDQGERGEGVVAVVWPRGR
jgi:hypothetical protein